MRKLYIVARVSDHVLHAEYDDKARKEIEMILTEDVTLDILVYSADEKPIEHYKEKLGEGIVPFALQMYGKIEARGQGISGEQYEDYITKLDKHLGFPDLNTKSGGKSSILSPEDFRG